MKFKPEDIKKTLMKESPIEEWVEELLEKEMRLHHPNKDVELREVSIHSGGADAEVWTYVYCSCCRPQLEDRISLTLEEILSENEYENS